MRGGISGREEVDKRGYWEVKKVEVYYRHM
jgi:hypothetical protein